LESALGRGSAPGFFDARGAALALWNKNEDAARAMVNAKAPELVPLLEAGTLTWENYEQA
jgi:hypothetical protein